MPSLTTSLLAASAAIFLLQGLPQPLRDSLLPWLSMPSPPKLAATLVVLAVVRVFNNLLNDFALNNWSLSRRADWNWPSEIAVVTGGSSGIGARLAEGLAQRGVKVAVLDITPISTKTPGIYYFECDVTSAESVASAAAAVRNDLGHPSILINNAGIIRPKLITESSVEDVRKVFEVNTISHWITTKEFLPQMIQLNKGQVVSISSASCFLALPGAADYAATKAAALAFHEALSCELKHIYKAPGVVSTIVHPNFVRTALLKEMAPRLEKVGSVMLECEDVAARILEQVFRAKGGQVIMPSSWSIAAGMRGYPNWVQELVRDKLGRAFGGL